MKKLGTLSIVVFLSLASHAVSAKIHTIKKNHTIHSDEPQVQQKTQETKKPKVMKYDFSLFKFIAPTSIQEKDTTQNLKENKLPKKDETVYENPRTFFKFS